MPRPKTSSTVDHSRPDCLISGGASSNRSHKTVARKSGRRVNRYLSTYCGTYTVACQSCRSYPAISRGSASQPPPLPCRSFSTVVPRKVYRTCLASHVMSLVAAANSASTHTLSDTGTTQDWGKPMGKDCAGYFDATYQGTLPSPVVGGVTIYNPLSSFHALLLPPLNSPLTAKAGTSKRLAYYLTLLNTLFHHTNLFFQPSRCSASPCTRARACTPV